MMQQQQQTQNISSLPSNLPKPPSTSVPISDSLDRFMNNNYQIRRDLKNDLSLARRLPYYKSSVKTHDVPLFDRPLATITAMPEDITFTDHNPNDLLRFCDQRVFIPSRPPLSERAILDGTSRLRLTPATAFTTDPSRVIHQTGSFTNGYYGKL